MQGFEKAQQEYESKMFAPYDKGGAYFDYDAYYDEKQDYLETQAEYMIEERLLSEDD